MPWSLCAAVLPFIPPVTCWWTGPASCWSPARCVSRLPPGRIGSGSSCSTMPAPLPCSSLWASWRTGWTKAGASPPWAQSWSLLDGCAVLSPFPPVSWPGLATHSSTWAAAGKSCSSAAPAQDQPASSWPPAPWAFGWVCGAPGPDGSGCSCRWESCFCPVCAWTVWAAGRRRERRPGMPPSSPGPQSWGRLF